MSASTTPNAAGSQTASAGQAATASGDRTTIDMDNLKELCGLAAEFCGRGAGDQLQSPGQASEYFADKDQFGICTTRWPISVLQELLLLLLCVYSGSAEEYLRLTGIDVISSLATAQLNMHNAESLEGLMPEFTFFQYTMFVMFEYKFNAFTDGSHQIRVPVNPKP